MSCRLAMQRLTVNGYDELMNSVAKLASTDVLFVFFTGSKDAQGKSWCPDCVTAEPVVESASETAFKSVSSGAFITCFVGDRTFWKDQNNVFRTDADLRLKGVPTLMDWKDKSKRLVEEQLFKADLVNMLFEEALG